MYAYAICKPVCKDVLNVSYVYAYAMYKLYVSYMYVYAMCKLYLSVSYIMCVCYVQAIFICRLYVSNMLSMLWVHIQYTYYELLLLHDNYSKQLVVFLVGSSVDAFGMSTFNPGDLADMEVSDYIYIFIIGKSSSFTVLET